MTNSKKIFRPNPELRLLDQVREVLRYYHYAYKTEQTYCEWIIRYIKFFNNEKHLRNAEDSVSKTAPLLAVGCAFYYGLILFSYRSATGKQSS